MTPLRIIESDDAAPQNVRAQGGEAGRIERARRKAGRCLTRFR